MGVGLGVSNVKGMGLMTVHLAYEFVVVLVRVLAHFEDSILQNAHRAEVMDRQIVLGVKEKGMCLVNVVVLVKVTLISLPDAITTAIMTPTPPTRGK